jgi:hypothetical protein
MHFCTLGLRIILIFRRRATISLKVISFMRGGKNDISFQIIKGVFPVLVLQDFIVDFFFSGLIIDVAYQKSTGTITGWYYHKNSELYVLLRSPLIAETKNSHSRYSLSPLLLMYSIAHEHKERFPFTNFDNHGYKRIVHTLKEFILVSEILTRIP